MLDKFDDFMKSRNCHELFWFGKCHDMLVTEITWLITFYVWKQIGMAVNFVYYISDTFQVVSLILPTVMLNLRTMFRKYLQRHKFIKLFYRPLTAMTVSRPQQMKLAMHRLRTG